MDAESQLVNDWENALKQKSGACVCSLSSTLRGGVLTVACWPAHLSYGESVSIQLQGSG